MSQLKQDSGASSGKPEKTGKLSWADFVRHVVELTIQAYQAMRRDHVAKKDWEENVFTVRLAEDYIRPIAFDNESPIRVSIRSKTHTEAMKEGKQATIEAKEIDLMLFDTWEREYHKRYFVWEAKRVGDKRVNEEYSVLNSEYVNEAIYRFIKNEYAAGLNDAGVLGYVLAGSVNNTVTDINNGMGNIRTNPPLFNSDNLRLARPVLGFEKIYFSSHKRTDNTHIQLHHLFLTFDFE